MRRVLPLVMVLVIGTILLYTVVNYLPPLVHFPSASSARLKIKALDKEF